MQRVFQIPSSAQMLAHGLKFEKNVNAMWAADAGGVVDLDPAPRRAWTPKLGTATW